MKTLYLECTSGIAGDMTVAALLDLGADRAVLEAGLSSLGVAGYRLQFGRVNKSGIDACKFDVLLEEEDGHHHDHPHEHEHEHHHHDHDHEHNHDHGHDHPHPHTHDHDHVHPHAHRGLPEIEALIRAAAISHKAKETALAIFRVVAAAEAKIHGKAVDEVHFHEVGAVDSIVDIVGTAICLDNLGVERVVASPLREGTGTVRCQHGLMPVPAPATLEIIRAHNIPLIITDNSGEMVTPTGAAIVAALAESFDPPGAVTILGVGYGAGTKEFKIANVVRAILFEGEQPAPDRVVKLECNLDDITGEALAYACEKLLEAGALDVWTTPILMKKGRPGQLLSVLCREDKEQALTELLFLHTTTIGVRVSLHNRQIMTRREVTLDTAYGAIAAKESRRGEIVRVKPEFDAVKAAAEREGLPLWKICE